MTHLNRRTRLLGLLAPILLLGLADGAVDPGVPSASTFKAPATTIAASEVRACQLDPEVETLGDEQLLRALAAWVCEQDQAFELLQASTASPDWEDWRLLAIARSAWSPDVERPSDAEPDEATLEVAATAATALLDMKTSPLRPLGLPLAVSLLAAQEQHEAALALVRESRQQSSPSSWSAELDEAAWQSAQALGDEEALRDEARHLLVHWPLEAEDLDALEALRTEDGSIPWSTHFDNDELLLRATNQVDSDLPEKALETLDQLVAEAREFDWHMLRALALIDARRGVEAVEVLGPVAAPDRTAHLELEWLRAQGALDAATARRGRTNLNSAGRNEMRSVAHTHLRNLVRQGGDSHRALDALHLLFEELADGEHFEEVLSILTRLRQLEPNDSSGSRYLWQLGWSQYRQRNPTGAIGYWRQLIEIYPDAKLARAALYWSGRAHQGLGNASRSVTLYEQLVASPSSDYYGQLALERLGRADQPAAPLAGAPITAWPRDPQLARAEALSDFGLDGLALIEVDQLAETLEPRAELALRSRILARQGKRRDSIQNLWRAFPILGGAFQDRAPQGALEMYYPLDFLDLVERFAADNNLPVSLLLAMIRQESAFDISARSWAGARGLMQVMPATARELAERMGLRYSTERLNEPDFSIQLGSRYFRQVLDMFDGQLELALAGYNAGPYRIKKMVRDAGPDLEIDTFLEDLRFEESKTYVRRIVLFSSSYERLYPDIG
jgi:soluble lytic murein transglycosylase-like protein